VEGFPPLFISGSTLNGGEVEISGKVSSQFITALLLVAPYFTKGLQLTIKDELVSKPYVHMTIELMRHFGAQVNWTNDKIMVMPKPYSYSEKTYLVESDWSAASYYYGLLAFSKIGASIIINGLFENSLQADSACRKIYENFGVTTVFKTIMLLLQNLKYHYLNLLIIILLNVRI